MTKHKIYNYPHYDVTQEMLKDKASVARLTKKEDVVNMDFVYVLVKNKK